MGKLRVGNKTIIEKYSKKDNTVDDGYITSEQLLNEMKKSAQTTVSYIQATKEKISEEDKIALKEQIENTEFRNQLKSAVFESKDKIDRIYHEKRIAKNINDKLKNYQNAKNKLEKSKEEYEKEILKYENQKLKEERKKE